MRDTRTFRKMLVMTNLLNEACTDRDIYKFDGILSIKVTNEVDRDVEGFLTSDCFCLRCALYHVSPGTSW